MALTDEQDIRLECLRIAAGICNSPNMLTHYAAEYLAFAQGTANGKAGAGVLGFVAEDRQAESAAHSYDRLAIRKMYEAHLRSNLGAEDAARLTAETFGANVA